MIGIADSVITWYISLLMHEYEVAQYGTYYCSSYSRLEPSIWKRLGSIYCPSFPLPKIDMVTSCLPSDDVVSSPSQEMLYGGHTPSLTSLITSR